MFEGSGSLPDSATEKYNSIIRGFGSTKVVQCSDASSTHYLVFDDILQVLVVTHQPLLIIKLKTQISVNNSSNVCTSFTHFVS